MKVIDENVFLDDFQLYGVRELDIHAEGNGFNELKLKMVIEKSTWK
ncbi:hypothetical protein [Listeria grayi]|nr:hypothetical protein [Listeria grayi]